MPSLYFTPEEEQADLQAQAMSGDVLWSDYFKAAAAGATDVAGAAPSMMRWIGESLPADSLSGRLLSARGREVGRTVNQAGEALSEDMSAPARARAIASIGSSDFLQHPFSSIALKATRTIPSVAASIGSTLFTAGGAPAIAAIAATSAGLSTGETLNEMYAVVDNMDDAELTDSSTLYKGYRNMGMSESQARKELNRAMIGYKPFGLMALGAATGVIGPAGQIAGALGKTGARAVIGASEGGIARRVGKEALQGGVSEFVQSGAEQLSSEKAAVDIGLQPSINWSTVAGAAAEGGLIGGLLGAPAGVSRSHTNANPRPNPINPPAAVVTNAVKPNQVSVPARANNTNASPAIVPPTGKHTGPTSRNATVPGAKGDAFKKSKQAPGPARRPSFGEVTTAGTAAAVTPATTSASAPGALAGVAPTLPVTQTPSPAPQGDPGGLVAGPTETAALNVQVAPTGISGPQGGVAPTGISGPQGGVAPTVAPAPVAPAPAPAPRTPSQVQQATGVPYAQAREVATQEGDTSGIPAAAAPAPTTPTPQVPARTPSPGEGFGAGPGAAPVVQGRPSAFGGVEVAASTQQAAPVQEVAAPIPAPVPKIPKENPHAARAAQHGVPPLQGKEAGRNEKLYDDADAAQALLDQRPTNPTVPVSEEDVNTFATEIEGILKTAAGQVSEFRGRVGFPTTPHSLVWLREAQEFVSKVRGKNVKFPAKLEAAVRFLDREIRIRKGEGEAVKAERKAEGEAVQAARGKGKGKVTEQTVEGATVASKTAKASELPPTEKRDIVQAGGLIKREDVAKAVTREVSPEARAEIEARTAAESVEAVKRKAAEAAKPKPLPPNLAEMVEAAKAKTAAKKAAQEANLPAKVREKKPLTVKATPEAVARAKAVAEAKKAPPKPSSQAASSADFAAKVKEEVEPNPSDAQIEAGNASKAHVSIEGMPLAIETAANTERHIVKPDGGRISRLYKYAYGHILGTKAPDGNPIDIFLGPEAYPNNLKLEGLPVVVIDQVDPDTKAPDEPKVMYGFERVTDPKKGTGAVEAYKDSYPRGEERIGDVTVMTPNEFKQWVKSKKDIKNAQEPAGEPVSELDALIAEQTEELSAETTEDISAGISQAEVATYLPAFNKFFPPKPTMEDRIAAQRAKAAEDLKVIQANTISQNSLSSYLGKGVRAILNYFFAGQVNRKWRALYPQFAKRVKAIAGDVQVHVLPDHIFNQVSDPAFAASYDPLNDLIIVKESTSKNTHYMARVALHEGTHAAFWKATHENPAFQTILGNILFEAREAGLNHPDAAQMMEFAGHYGVSNIDELLAEAFSNERFQEFLASQPASDRLRRQLGLGPETRSLWDVLIGLIGRVLGLPNVHDSLLAAVLKTAGHMELEAPNLVGPASDTAIKWRLGLQHLGHYSWKKPVLSPLDVSLSSPLNIRETLDKNLPARVSRLLGTDTALQEQAGSPWLMGLRTMDQIVQAAKSYGRPFYEHLRKAADTIERIRTSADRYLQEAMPVIRELHDLERKYKGTTRWQEFTDLVMDETSVGVFADRPLPQKHLGKNTLRGVYPKARHAELHARWQVLPDDLKDARLKAMNFFTEQQNLERIGIIRNTLKVTGFDDPDLTQRLFDGDETEADIAALGRTYDHIKDASELAKIKGPYFPQMRRGEHVVRALYRITPPTNALRQVDDNTWEFVGKQARKQAAAFAAVQDHMKPTISPVWVDTNTGERYFNLGQPDEVRVRPEDADAEQRFRVNIQNRYVEFFESKREALQVAAELRSNSAVESVQDVVPRKFNPGDRQADMMSNQMQVLASSLERRPGYQALSPNQQNQVVQALNTASLRLLSSTRIQTKRLPRTNVLGASKDLTRNTLEYAKSVSGYLARLDHQDDLNQAMTAARKEADSSNDFGKGYGQGDIMNEMEQRVARSQAFESSGKAHEWGNRLLAVSFASKLISPAYNILNSLQVAMVSYPALAARFGAGRAAAMLFRTYREIGTGQAIKGGLVASKRTLIQGPGAVTPSIVDDIISRIKSPQVRAMLKHLIEVGSIDPNAGIEVADMIETRTGGVGSLDQGLNYLGTFGRQMPKAVEAINRTVTAIAAYNLEMQRSGDHDTAVRFAQETTNMTQGLYSHSNAAPVFNHPLGRLSLQFKKFGQLVYGMIGHNIGKAIANAEPGDRAEAVKTLLFMTATHFVMAGALGLPQEPLKWLIIGARAAGADVSWADWENWQREMLSSALGQQLGEIAARGITRALPEGFAFDLSSRVGLQDLLTFGEPRSADKQDLSAFLWDTVAGAPLGLVGDWTKGSQALLNGEWGEAAQRFSPVKMVTDAIKSYRVTSEGKKTAAGYESLAPYGAGEAVLRTLGFTPAREAETTEARNYFYSAMGRAKAARENLMHQWVTASPGERGKLWGQVEKFNYGKEKDEKLTRSDLDRYAKRRKTEEREGLVKGGFRVTRRDKNIYKKVQETYTALP